MCSDSVTYGIFKDMFMFSMLDIMFACLLLDKVLTRIPLNTLVWYSDPDNHVLRLHPQHNMYNCCYISSKFVKRATILDRCQKCIQIYNQTFWLSRVSLLFSFNTLPKLCHKNPHFHPSVYYCQCLSFMCFSLNALMCDRLMFSHLEL